MATEVGVEISIEASQKTGAITATSNEVAGLQKQLGEAGEAAKKGTESIGALDEASKALTSSLANLVSAAAIGAFFKEAIAESLKEAEALRTLRFAIESTGASWDKARGQVEAFAQAQQASTRFDDTVTFEVLGKLQRATGDLASAMSATALAQDIAAASGKDLAETTALVNGLLTGQERSVKLAQKEFAAYVGTADTTQSVLTALEKGFTGAAQSEQSFTKSIAQSKNFLADFQQTVGDGLVPVLDILLRSLAFVAKGWEQLGVAIATTLAASFVGITNAADAFKAALSGNFSQAIEIARGTQDQIATVFQEGAAKVSEIEDRFETEKSIKNEERKALRATASEEEVNKKLADIEKEKAAIAKKDADEKAAVEKRKQQFSAFLSFTSTLSQSKNKELAAIGKAAAIGAATIDTYRAATGAYAALSNIPIVGPALGAAAAAAAITAGLANVAKISGVAELAEGGIVSASSGGINAVIGEGGSDEAVIPLSNSAATRRIADALGGGANQGNTTINNTFILPGLEALRDPQVAREIMEIIADQMARETPEARVAAGRTSSLAQLHAGRST